MSFKLAEFFIDITARDSGLQAAMRGARSQLGGWVGQMSRMTNIALWGGAAAAVGGLGLAVRTAIQLESAYANLRKTTGLAGPDFDRLKTELETLATTQAGVRLSDILDIATMAGRLGIAGDDIAGFTKDVAYMRIAMSDIPAEDLTRDIARIQNVLKFGTASTLSFGSALNKLDDTTTATGAEILDVTQRLSGSFVLFRRGGAVAAQESLALAAAIKDAGISSEVAGTAFKGIFALMAKDAGAFAAVAGTSVETFATAVERNPLEALQLLMTAMKGMSFSEASRALDAVGIDGRNATGALLQLAQVSDRIPAYIATANSEWDSHASILREVEERGKTTDAALDLLGNHATLMARDIGAVLTPALTQLAGLFNIVSTDIRAGLKDQQSTVTAWQAGLATSIETIGLVYRSLGDIVERTGVLIAGRVFQIGDTFATLGSMILTSIQDALRLAWGVFQSWATNIGAVIDEVAAYFTSGFTDKIDLDFAGMAERMAAAVAAGMPARTVAMPGMREDFVNQLAVIDERMAASEQRRLDLAAAAEAGVGAAGAAVAGVVPAPPGGAVAAAGKATFGEVVSVSELESRLLKAAAGAVEDKTAAENLKVNKGNKKTLELILAEMRKRGEKVSAATFGA
jgi:TP901 family phage tail tape measure protein